MKWVSFITCVNDPELYDACVKQSLEAAERRDEIERIVIENASNRYSIPEALNRGMEQAQGEILVFCHQDVEFPEGWTDRLKEQIGRIEREDPDWGVLGTYGVDFRNRHAGHIIDQGIRYQNAGLPCPVQSLDEHCLIIKRGAGLRFDEAMGGYHFYGADLCLQALALGRKNYAIDACLHHHAAGKKLDAHFAQALDRLSAKWTGRRSPLPVIETTCAVVRLAPGPGPRLLYHWLKRKRRRIGKKRRAEAMFSLDMHNKPAAYFQAIRKEMLEFLPAVPKRMLEFGGGAGEFSAHIKERYGTETWAVELNPQAAQAASRKLDRVICADAEASLEQLPDRYYDCIVMFDFLEHLVDPFSFLRGVREKLTPDGLLVASIPNVRHYKTLCNYVIRGDWQYEVSGILDNSHLRFFTRRSILKMFAHLGYEVVRIEGINRSRKTKLKVLNWLTLNRFGDTVYLQFAVQARPKSPSGDELAHEAVRYHC